MTFSQRTSNTRAGKTLGDVEPLVPAGAVTPAISVCAGPRPAQVLSDWLSRPYPEAPASPFPLVPVWGVQGTGMDVSAPVPVGSVQTGIRVQRGWSPARTLLAPHSPGFSKPLPEPRASRATSKTFCLPDFALKLPPHFFLHLKL